MEVKTIEIEKFITIKFNEKDLINLYNEIDFLKGVFNEQKTTYHKYRDKEFIFIENFLNIILNKKSEIKYGNE